MPDAATNSSLQFNSIHPGMEVARLRAWLNHSSCFTISQWVRIRSDSEIRTVRNGMQASHLVTPTPLGSPWIPSCSLALAPYSLARSLTRSSCVVVWYDCASAIDAPEFLQAQPTEPEERSGLHRITRTHAKQSMHVRSRRSWDKDSHCRWMDGLDKS